eukprot:TRINITY_DN27885_c0_g1_i1.p1 TRINITY_DN27885_c0_g1~~TRINITY_DN27885_c0_g1_i1.p1  ORF type:complete len:201 (+),score=90.77 TRINITY_DN27885_c0_g1_i1:118-720(+)
MNERVRLYESNEQREQYELCADLYCMVVAIEKVEKAYMRSSMSAQDYDKQCKILLKKYKGIYDVLKGNIGSLQKFLEEYRSSYPTAVARIQAGVPLTDDDGQVASGQKILEAGQYMITCVDSLKMGQVSADTLQPIFADIVSVVGRLYPDIPELEGVRGWLKLVNSMRAAEELSDEQVRQCQHDVEVLYGAFSRKLSDSK